MIDIHSHIVFGVDDGPSTMEESIKMVSEAEKAGIKVIIATPHFQEHLFDDKRVMENFMELKQKAADYQVTLKIGSEIFINPFISNLIYTGRSMTLDNSKYVLIEMPFGSIPVYCYETIFKLKLNNIHPIIAHPERNRIFLKDFELFMEFLGRGCMIQVDAASIIGVYGNDVKNFTKRLIKLNMAHFVASDAHCANDYTNWYIKAYKKIENWAGEEYADTLFNSNARNILDEKMEDFYEPAQQIKSSRIL